MKTLYLVPDSWDLTLDSAGNIALASEPYALAQDAASAIKTFAGEVYYNTLLGVPYFAEILGVAPPVELMKARFVEAALTVPGVVTAKAFIASIRHREVSGQVQVTAASGQTVAIGFGQPYQSGSVLTDAFGNIITNGAGDEITT